MHTHTHTHTHTHIHARRHARTHTHKEQTLGWVTQIKLELNLTFEGKSQVCPSHPDLQMWKHSVTLTLSELMCSNQTHDLKYSHSPNDGDGWYCIFKAWCVSLLWQHDQAAQFLSEPEDISIYDKLSFHSPELLSELHFTAARMDIYWSCSPSLHKFTSPKSYITPHCFLRPIFFTALFFKLFGGAEFKLTTVGVAAINLVLWDVFSDSPVYLFAVTLMHSATLYNLSSVVYLFASLSVLILITLQIHNHFLFP